MAVRQRFGEWNLYHKAVAVFTASLVFGVIVRAVLVIDTAFEIKGSRLIKADAETVWRYVITDDLRDNWQGELIDLAELSGPTATRDTTRLLFWKHGLKRWQSIERTTAILPGRSVTLYQESDTDRRWLDISLVVQEACATELVIKEIIEPLAYEDRFWFFGARKRHEARLNASFDAMQHWAEGKSGSATCSQG